MSEKKNNNCKKYFLYQLNKTIKNENKILTMKYAPSVRELLSDYQEIFIDYQENFMNDKYQKSMDDIISAIKFFFKEDIAYKNNDSLKKDFLYLLKLIDDSIKNSNKSYYKQLYIISKTLIKKMKSLNLTEIIIEKVIHETNYENIDKAVISLVNELMFSGYSLKFLSNWMNTNNMISDIMGSVKDEVLTQKIKEIIVLNTNPNLIDYVFYFNIYNFEHFSELETINISNDLILEKINFDILKTSQELSEKTLKQIPPSTNHSLYKISLKFHDMYKGLEFIKEALINYLQLIIYLENNKASNIILPKIFSKSKDGVESTISFNDLDEELLFSGIEAREKYDIIDFVNYREQLLQNGLPMNDAINLQKSLNIVKNQKDQSSENKLLNLWGVMESILTFYDGNSIIGKIKDIIPKLVCLYYIKKLLNNFWSDLLKYKGRRADFPIIDEIFNECLEGENKYDLDKLLNFIKTKGEQLTINFDFNDILKRDISKIGAFLFDKKSRIKIIENLKDSIENDLIRIYRTRNILIHSGNRTNTNINLKTLRLSQYNNHLLGVIIYYKRKNHDVTIEEILNSINLTYINYTEILNEKKPNHFDMCKPKYLFM